MLNQILTALWCWQPCSWCQTSPSSRDCDTHFGLWSNVPGLSVICIKKSSISNEMNKIYTAVLRANIIQHEWAVFFYHHAILIFDIVCCFFLIFLFLHMAEEKFFVSIYINFSVFFSEKSCKKLPSQPMYKDIVQKSTNLTIFPFSACYKNE